MNQDPELLMPSQIIYSKRKTVSLVIKPGGEFIVRSPKKADPQRILDFIKKKQSWISKTRLKLAQTKGGIPKIEFIDRAILPFLGQEITLKFNLTQSIDCIYDQISLVLYLNPSKKPIQEIIFSWLQKQARLMLNQELKYWAAVMKLTPKQFRLSSAKTRWGSCSGKNAISLNWRLILTPLEVLQYVVIHELAHIAEKNHSIDFWNIVAKFDPNFKLNRKYLKTMGHGLIASFS